MTKAAYIPWRDRAFVSIREAAQIVGRSPDWIRNRIAENRLQARQHQIGGPLVVTVPSLTAYIDGIEASPLPQVRERRLYLAVDNT